ncbi:MAG TPA: DUF2807 domain-containing protein [Vicinamibacterales bacterium]|jgi:hypothetical protein|nr:DUF2807 domain-containing protein [Vicinamibacterales bacterium]
MRAMLSRRTGLLVSCGVLLSGCVVNAINGSGTIKSESRPAAGFSRVVLSGGGRLVLNRAGSESVSVSADDNLLPYIRTDVHGNTLDLGFDDSMNGIRPTKDVVFTVSAKQLEELTVSGSGVADVKDIDRDSFRATISGSGTIEYVGTPRVSDHISGSGTVRRR